MKLLRKRKSVAPKAAEKKVRSALTRRSTPPPEETVIPPAFAPIVKALSGRPGVTLARMFSSRGVLKVDGKLFAMVVRDQLVVKLPRPRVADLVGSGRAVHFDPGHGRLMKEWASIAEGVPWLPLAEEAYSFVHSVGAAKVKPRVRAVTTSERRTKPSRA
jgi:hypothetical protein